MLYEGRKNLPKNGRAEFQETNIEFTHHACPVSDLENEFGVKLQGARVVYEESDIGSKVLEQAHELYAQPIGWTKENMNSHALWMKGRIDGMKDTIDQPCCLKNTLQISMLKLQIIGIGLYMIRTQNQFILHWKILNKKTLNIFP